MKTQHLTIALAVFIGAFGLATHAAPPISVASPASSVKKVENPANRPFAKLLCLTSVPGGCNVSVDEFVSLDLPGEFKVPAFTSTGKSVKRLVIEFVSGYCVGTGRSTYVSLNSRPDGGYATDDTGDNFTNNLFPLAVAQFNQTPGAHAVQGFAQPARIYLDPGVTAFVSFDITEAGGLSCVAQINGYFVVK